MADRLEPVGFWSYTTQDDRVSGGHLSQLRVQFANELQLQLGRQHVHIFQDVAAIPHGADWDKAIHGALSTANFMIPIVTPGFLASEWCCKELMRFRDREDSLGRDNLIFPFVYVPIDNVDPARKSDCHDPAAYDLILARQQFKFSELRFKEAGSGEVRQKLNELARSVVGALRAVDGHVQIPAGIPAVAPGLAPAPVPTPSVQPAPMPVNQAPVSPMPVSTLPVSAGPVPPAGPAAAPGGESRGPARNWFARAAGLIAAVAIGVLIVRDAPAPKQTVAVQQPAQRVEPATPAATPKPPAETPSPTARQMTTEQPPPRAEAVKPADPPKAVATPMPPAPTEPTKPADPIQQIVAAIEANMVTIPAGRFRMGSPPGEPGRYSDEGPQHDVSVRSFAIGKYTVTFAEWDACVADNGCGGYRPSDKGWGRGNRPAINVSWDDAQAFARWLSGKTGKTYRLPSEAEWEYAARAGTLTAYYWGPDIGKGNANCNGCGSQWDNGQTAPVGSFAPNPRGLYDMAGNVWQWTQDCWHDDYTGAPGNSEPWTTESCNYRVLRGGSWVKVPRGVRAARRDRDDPGIRFDDAGFRVARTLP